MDNIQLAIFLEKYQVMLAKAVQQVKNDLPDELKETVRNIIGQERQIFPVMEPIEEVLAWMDDDVELLKKSGTASTIVNNTNRG